ncbi:MAG: ABC transporter permease [Gemmatimonadota bacterium]|nr:ABC transporter permease [Gemmatimonadota bacterium]MDH3366799.1 ABC transporter permease [Gemmatimonadota bacterium]MDH3476931.1 ABC transporter permease [Gemmatimonadota bacterium]MDH3569212.1 ABC transporter permease [Gemmatimonadota bacterium]MDH5548265.1 ABC transporter permease [Gemmatimonadota bacterium]
MRKIWVVVRREFVEKVRNKWFIISTVLGPLLMASFVVLPILMAERGGAQRRIVVVDLGTVDLADQLVGVLRAPLPVTATLLRVEVADLADVADSLTALVGAKEVDGYLIVSEEAVEDGTVEYRGSNVSSMADMQVLERLLRETVMTERLGRAGVDAEVVQRARIPLRMRTLSIRGGKVTEGSGESAFILAYAVWLVLYMAILLYGVQVMGAVVEEKTSRVIELLISSLRPFQLLAGKVIGVGAVGLFQLAIWGVCAWLLFQQRDLVLRLVGIDAGPTGGFAFPAVPLETIAIVLTYFLLGYFLYAAMFAAVGAMSNSDAEARQAQTPVIMLLVIPTVLMLGILQQPDGAMAVSLSLIPFCSPIAMPVRWAAATVPIEELALSIGLLVAALLLVVWVAARIYRVGILMYGKRPNPKELWRWIRTT